MKHSADPRRVAEGIAQTVSRNADAHKGSTGCTLGGTVYVDRVKPRDCGLCGKKGDKLKRWRDDFNWECSAVECPTRRNLTAQRSS